MIQIQPGQWTFEIERRVDLDAYELQVHGVSDSGQRLWMRRSPIPVGEFGPAEAIVRLLERDAFYCARATPGVSGEPVDPLMPHGFERSITYAELTETVA